MVSLDFGHASCFCLLLDLLNGTNCTQVIHRGLAMANKLRVSLESIGATKSCACFNRLRLCEFCISLLLILIILQRFSIPLYLLIPKFHSIPKYLPSYSHLETQKIHRSALPQVTTTEADDEMRKKLALASALSGHGSLTSSALGCLDILVYNIYIHLCI